MNNAFINAVITSTWLNVVLTMTFFRGRDRVFRASMCAGLSVVRCCSRATTATNDRRRQTNDDDDNDSDDNDDSDDSDDNDDSDDSDDEQINERTNERTNGDEQTVNDGVME